MVTKIFSQILNLVVGVLILLPSSFQVPPAQPFTLHTILGDGYPMEGIWHP
jgi:hypothetical protein